MRPHILNLRVPSLYGTYISAVPIRAQEDGLTFAISRFLTIQKTATILTAVCNVMPNSRNLLESWVRINKIRKGRSFLLGRHLSAMSRHCARIVYPDVDNGVPSTTASLLDFLGNPHRTALFEDGAVTFHILIDLEKAFS